MLERTDAITKEVPEPFMFVLVYPTVYKHIRYIYIMYSIKIQIYVPLYTASVALMTSTSLECHIRQRGGSATSELHLKCPQ
jgi:hypothetical protein